MKSYKYNFRISDVKLTNDAIQVERGIRYISFTGGCLLVTGDLDDLFFTGHECKPVIAEYLGSLLGCEFYCFPEAYNWDDVYKKIEDSVIHLLEKERRENQERRRKMHIDYHSVMPPLKTKKPKSFLNKLLEKIIG